MAKAPFSDLLLYLRKVCGSQAARDLTDAQLLERFQLYLDEASFSVLVHRHGPMILSVCRRVLGNAHGAEDAFQATFMILVRRLASISCKGSLGGWLQSVAQQAKVLVMVLALGLGLGGAGVTGYGALGVKSQPAVARQSQTPPAKSQKAGPQEKDASVATDLYGDPLPQDAIGRLGTVRFRQTNPSALAFAAGGKVLVSAGDGFGVSLWDATSGRPLHRLSVPYRVWALAVSPDGKSLFVPGVIPSVIDVASGKELCRFDPALGGGLRGGAFSPDGRTVAAGGRVGGAATIILWDVQTGKELHRLQGHTSEVRSIAFAPEGKVLASGSDDKTIRLWDLGSGNEVRRFESNEYGFLAVAFAKNGKALASVGQDGAIQLWDVATGEQRRDFKKEKARFDAIAISPDGNLIAGAETKGTAYLWDADTGKEIRSWQASRSNFALTFAPDGKVLASVGLWDTAIRRWDAATGVEIGAVAGHSAAVWPVVIQPGGKTLISRGQLNDILEWDFTTFRQRRELLSDALGPRKEGYIWRIAGNSQDGRVAALVWIAQQDQKPDYAISLWDCQAKKEFAALKGHATAIANALFSPDGKVVTTVAWNESRLWDAATGMELYRLKGVDGLAIRFNAPTFSPDSTRLAYFDAECRLRLMEIATGKELLRWETPHDGLGVGAGLAIHFAPDGKSLATCDFRSTHIWRVDSGKELVQLTRQNPGIATQQMILNWAFNPTGRVLAGGGFEDRALNGDDTRTATIRLWDTISGQEIRQIDTPQGYVSALAFAPDGRTLVSGGSDSTMLVYDLTGSSNGGKRQAAPFTGAELDKLWSQLGADAPLAERALWALALAPKQVLPLLKGRMQPVPPAPQEQVAKLLAGLDSDQFPVRQKTAKALADLGEAAEAGLRKAVTGKLTLEVRQRIEQILANRDKETVRRLRAIEVLEQIGTPEAREVLLALASGTPNPRVADAAGAALRRLAKDER